MPRIIVCLIGMPGAGKTTIAHGLAGRGYCIFNMGDAVRAEAKRQNLEPTRQNLGALMLEMRRIGGSGAIAESVKDEIDAAGPDVAIVDGIRSNEEIAVFKKIAPVRLLSIHASTDTRFDFLAKRGRSDDPEHRDSFEERDVREINVGITEPMALADESISNNNLTPEELVDTAEKVISGWL